MIDGDCCSLPVFAGALYNSEFERDCRSLLLIAGVCLCLSEHSITVSLREIDGVCQCLPESACDCQSWLVFSRGLCNSKFDGDSRRLPVFGGVC